MSKQTEVKKIIPCLDFKDGKVVKGIHFVDIKDVGDPVENAVFYQNEGADELAFLDISATVEGRATALDAVKAICKNITIPLTVGGGIANFDDIERVLAAGATRVSINSAAYKNPNLIKEASKKFGKNAIMVAIDAKEVSIGKFNLFINAGTKDTGIDAIMWAKKMEKLGAGSLLPTSIDRDGAKNGYNISLTKAITDAVKIPVIASGGCGKSEDILEVLTKTNSTAALAASVFHFRQIKIKELKQYLKNNGVKVNL